MKDLSESCKWCGGSGLILIGLGDTETCNSCQGKGRIVAVKTKEHQEFSRRLYAEQVKAREDMHGIYN